MIPRVIGLAKLKDMKVHTESLVRRVCVTRDGEGHTNLA